MHKRRGFTLIELLVVIAIIALLMAILIPALARAKKQASAVACMSNLKQWGIIWAMYTDNNSGYFPTRTATTGRWINELYDYYYKIEKMRCCPMARKYAVEYPPGASGVLEVGGDAFTSWGKLDTSVGRPAGTYGSYGLNEWVDVPDPSQTSIWGKPVAYFWRTPSVKGAANIPLFLDCWFFGGWPDDDDAPPGCDGRACRGTGGDDDAMNRFCINRHQLAINGIFLDYSVRKIGLKGLWRLKWSKRFDINAPNPAWPSWMRNAKDY